jgi:hypothetical protein
MSSIPRRGRKAAPQNPPAYEVCILDGRIIFEGVPVNDILDTDSRTYSISGRLSREALVRLAFYAGQVAARREVRHG